MTVGKVESDDDEEEDDEEEPSTLKGALYLFTGGIMIIIFSPLFINAVVEVASLMKVNPALLAFFLAPVASEAPEIMESISLSRKGSSQNINIAFSNLIGGTITKTTLLCGVSDVLIPSKNLFPFDSFRSFASTEFIEDSFGKRLLILSAWLC